MEVFMGKIIVRKESDHWRAFIKDGKKVVVIDGVFDSDIDAARAALGINR